MDNIVVLNDNDGNELEFEYLDLIEHNETWRLYCY